MSESDGAAMAQKQGDRDRPLRSGDGSKGRKPSKPPWETLNCEDGGAITVPDGWTDKATALVRLLEAEYGDLFDTDNPAIIDALPSTYVRVWRSYLRADHESLNTEWEPGDGTYYGDEGSGAKHITVCWFLGSTFHLWDKAKASLGAVR